MLLSCVVGGGIFARAQEQRPEFIPGERKAARKKDAGPRALAVLQMSANGKVTLVPVAILVNGKFWDASAYKANPVPMALETGTVYEGERTGSSVGLFTVQTALHSLAANAAVPWIGTGAWLAEGKDAPNQPMKAETAPVGINTSDEPPRLTKGGSSSGDKPGPDKSGSDKPSGDKPAASGAPSSSPSSSSSPPSSGDEPPRLSRPAQTSGSGNSGSGQSSSGSSPTQSAPGSSTPSSSTQGSSQTSSAPASPADGKSSSDKPSDDRPSLKRPDQNPEQNPKQDKSNQSAGDKASSESKTPESDSGAGAGYRPRLRRGRPTTSFADEDVPGYSKPGVKPSASAKAAAAPEIVDLVPAISDAGSNDLHPFNFNFLKDEEGERRKQIEGIAKQDVLAYVNARAKATVTPSPASTKTGARTAAHTTAKKTPDPVLENVKMVAYDLWGNNTPVIVFSADAHLPAPPAGAAHSEVANETVYSVTLVLRPDIYDTLRNLYVGLTDKYHLDITPRLQLIDAVDADGDGRGELLFKEVSDAGAGWILYRASADKLWKMFDSLSPE